ncbi:MAG: PD-(D/E)XK nuclease family protein [Thermoleophilia bacterium]|nr:PD-(D/E)XK nuclease family protein [Thermoleophilia bacterium]
MAFRLLCGPANAGKVAHVFTTVREAAAANGGGAWLVVPTDTAAEHVRRELTAQGTLLGVTVGTFHALVRELAARDDLQPADRGVERFVMRRVLEQSSAFRASARYQGFLDTAHGHVTALRSAAVAGTQAQADTERLLPGPKLAWHQLTAAWVAVLERHGVYDDAWFEAAACNRLTATDSTWTTSIAVYGFDDLSAIQRHVLCCAAQSSIDVLVALPFEHGRLVFERRASLVKQFLAGGAVVEDAGEAHFDAPELVHLERSWSEPTADAMGVSEPLDGSPVAIAAIECCGDLQEAEEVIRETARLLASGIVPSEIAVVAANPGPMRPLLEFAAHRAGIPITVELSRSISETPAGRALVQLLTALANDDALRFTAFLRSHLVDVHHELIDRYEFMLRTVRATHVAERPPGWWVDERVIPASAHGLLHAAVPAALRAMVTACTVDTSKPDLDLLVAGIATLHPTDEGDVRLISSIVSTMRAIVTSTAGLAQPTLAELVDAVEAVRLPASRRGGDANAILVAPITAVRTDRFDAVIVFGLHDSAFGAMTDDPDDVPVAARELAYTAFTRARKIVRAIRQVATVDGGKLAPHPAWLELARLVHPLPRRERGLRDVIPAPSELVLPHELADAAALAVGEQRSTDAYPRELVEHTLAARVSTMRDGEILVPAVGAYVRNRGRVGATQIEEYDKCPTHWMLKRVVAKTRDPDDDVTSLVRGNLAHWVLEKFVAEHVTEHGVAPGVNIDQRVGELLDNAAALERAKGSPVREIDLAIVHSDLLEVLPGERLLGTSTLSEVSIDVPDVVRDAAHPERITIPALTVDGIAITGRIDRIDIDEQQRVVLQDYKYSKSPAGKEATKLVSSSSLQLLIYWIAIERSDLPWQPVAALYRILRGARRPRGLVVRGEAPKVPGAFPKDELSRDSADELVADVHAITEQVVQGMLAGEVPLARPDRREKVCVYCEFSSVCRINEVLA